MKYLKKFETGWIGINNKSIELNDYAYIENMDITFVERFLRKNKLEKLGVTKKK